MVNFSTAAWRLELFNLFCLEHKIMKFQILPINSLLITLSTLQIHLLCHVKFSTENSNAVDLGEQNKMDCLIKRAKEHFKHICTSVVGVPIRFQDSTDYTHKKHQRVQPSSLPVSLHHINKVISCDITAQSDVGVVDLVFRQDAFNGLSIQLSLCTLMKTNQIKLVRMQLSCVVTDSEVNVKRVFHIST